MHLPRWAETWAQNAALDDKPHERLLDGDGPQLRARLELADDERGPVGSDGVEECASGLLAEEAEASSPADGLCTNGLSSADARA